MDEKLLGLLRCPFCGGRFNLLDNAALARAGGRLESGVIWCECCAFPIVAGIPVLRADDTTRRAMHALEAGRRDEALLAMLGLDEPDRAQAFRDLLARGDRLTYREAIGVLSPDPEGTYFLYRFSDPTFAELQKIRTFLYHRMYRHWTVQRMRRKAKRVVNELFTSFMEAPELMPDGWNACGTLGETDRARVVADYIAGMTDRFALQEHAKLTDPMVKG